MVGVREKTISSHDCVFSFYHDFSSQRTDLLIVLVLANPASIFLSGTDGEVAVVYTDHSVVALCWSEGCPCDDNVVVVGLPFSGIDEGDSVEEGEGDTCSRDWVINCIIVAPEINIIIIMDFVKSLLTHLSDAEDSSLSQYHNLVLY